MDGATGVRVRPSICGFAAAREGKKWQQCRGRLRDCDRSALKLEGEGEGRERGEDL